MRTCHVLLGTRAIVDGVGAARQAAGIKKTIRAWFYLPNKRGSAGPEEVRGLFTLTENGPGGRPMVEYRGKAKPGDETSLIAILEATEAVAQAYPAEESIAEATALVESARAYLYASADVLYPISRCIFTAGEPAPASCDSRGGTGSLALAAAGLAFALRRRRTG